MSNYFLRDLEKGHRQGFKEERRQEKNRIR